MEWKSGGQKRPAPALGVLYNESTAPGGMGLVLGVSLALALVSLVEQKQRQLEAQGLANTPY